MMIGRTPTAVRAAQRQQQREYHAQLSQQVRERDSARIKEAAEAMAAKYSRELNASIGGPPPHARPPLAEQGREKLRGALVDELEERFRYVRQAFLAADVDRSGYLEAGELRRLCAMYNLPGGRVEEVLALCDPNRDGKISYAEFSHNLSRPDYPGRERAAEAAPVMQRPNYSVHAQSHEAPSWMAPLPVPGTKRDRPGKREYGNFSHGNQQPGGGALPIGATQPPHFRTALQSMWHGKPDGSAVDEAQRKKQEWIQALEGQIRERKAREARAKQESRNRERKAEMEAASYNPWGRGGAGAPLRDDTGKIVTDLRDLHEAAEAGGLSPNGGGAARRAVPRWNEDAYGGGGNIGIRAMPHFNEEQQQQQQRQQQQKNGFSGMTVAIPGSPTRRLEASIREQKRLQLQNDLRKQVEEKRMKKEAEKRRLKELELADERRVRREQAEIRNAYLKEHKDKEEKDAAEASARSAAAKASVMNAPEGFSPKSHPPRRTPPTQGSMSASMSPGGLQQEMGAPSRGGLGLTALRSEMARNHQLMLGKIEQQQSMVEALQAEILRLARRGPEVEMGSAKRAHEWRYANGMEMNVSLQGRSELIPHDAAATMNGNSSMGDALPSLEASIRSTAPEALDELLLNFVNKR
eukprot:g113.t1